MKLYRITNETHWVWICAYSEIEALDLTAEIMGLGLRICDGSWAFGDVPEPGVWRLFRMAEEPQVLKVIKR